MSFPAEVTISAINFDLGLTPIDSNISFLVVSYLSCFYIQRVTDYKTTFSAEFALTTPLIVNRRSYLIEKCVLLRQLAI